MDISQQINNTRSEISRNINNHESFLDILTTSINGYKDKLLSITQEGEIISSICLENKEKITKIEEIIKEIKEKSKNLKEVNTFREKLYQFYCEEIEKVKLEKKNEKVKSKEVEEKIKVEEIELIKLKKEIDKNEMDSVDKLKEIKLEEENNRKNIEKLNACQKVNKNLKETKENLIQNNSNKEIEIKKIKGEISKILLYKEKNKKENEKEIEELKETLEIIMDTNESTYENIKQMEEEYNKKERIKREMEIDIKKESNFKEEIENKYRKEIRELNVENVKLQKEIKIGKIRLSDIERENLEVEKKMKNNETIKIDLKNRVLEEEKRDSEMKLLIEKEKHKFKNIDKEYNKYTNKLDIENKSKSFIENMIMKKEEEISKLEEKSRSYLEDMKKIKDEMVKRKKIVKSKTDLEKKISGEKERLTNKIEENTKINCVFRQKDKILDISIREILITEFKRKNKCLELENANFAKMILKESVNHKRKNNRIINYKKRAKKYSVRKIKKDGNTKTFHVCGKIVLPKNITNKRVKIKRRLRVTENNVRKNEDFVLDRSEKENNKKMSVFDF